MDTYTHCVAFCKCWVVPRRTACKTLWTKVHKNANTHVWASREQIRVSTLPEILEISGNFGFVKEIFGKGNNSRICQEIQDYGKLYLKM